MIRINLLGQAKPKASRRPVDTGAALPALFVGAGVLFGALILGYLYYSWQRQLNDENTRIKQLQAQKTDLEQVKQQVDAFEKQKIVLQQRVSTIEQLQRDRTGGQELLDEIASTVARTENLVADLPDPQGQYPDDRRRFGIGQRCRELHYRSEAFRILLQNRDQGVEAGRQEHRGTNLLLRGFRRNHSSARGRACVAHASQAGQRSSATGASSAVSAESRVTIWPIHFAICP